MNGNNLPTENGQNIAKPESINASTLNFLIYSAANPEDCGCDIVQTVKDALRKPERIAEKILAAALVGAQSRSNRLYERALDARSVEEKSVYLKYAAKYANTVASLAEVLLKSKDKRQTITVERINIERGAQAIVGAVSHG